MNPTPNQTTAPQCIGLLLHALDTHDSAAEWIESSFLENLHAATT